MRVQSEFCSTLDICAPSQPTGRNPSLYIDFSASITGFLNSGLKRPVKSSQSLLVMGLLYMPPRSYVPKGSEGKRSDDHRMQDAKQKGDEHKTLKSQSNNHTQRHDERQG